MIRVAGFGLSTGKQAVRVRTVDDLDLMPAPRQLLGELLHEDPVAAEVVWRVEGRDHAEAQGSAHARTRTWSDVKPEPEPEPVPASSSEAGTPGARLLRGDVRGGDSNRKTFPSVGAFLMS